MRHGRRQILWLGVTPHPSAEWISNQLTEACGWEPTPDDLIRDRDACYGHVFMRRLRSLGIRDHPTSPRSPWQNGYAERLIGSTDGSVLTMSSFLESGTCVMCCRAIWNTTTRRARTCRLARMHRSGASFNQKDASNANLFSVACTTNMREFDLRQAQAAIRDWLLPYMRNNQSKFPKRRAA
jgi:transposase InsO family protein